MCVYSKSPTDVEAAHEILSVHNGVKLDNNVFNCNLNNWFIQILKSFGSVISWVSHSNYKVLWDPTLARKVSLIQILRSCWCAEIVIFNFYMHDGL